MKKLRSESKHDAMLDGRYCSVAAAVIGSAVVGGVVSSNSASKAASQQRDAANQANATQQQFYNQTRTDQAPYRQAGNNALGAIQNGFGIQNEQGFDGAAYLRNNPDVAAAKLDPYQHYLQYGKAEGRAYTTTAQPGSGATSFGQFNHQFDANDLKSGLAPNYDFQLQQGLNATNNLASVSGGLVGGNALKGIQDYAQGSAGSAYQQAFNNYNTNQTNIYNRLSSLAGLGQTSNGQTTQAGQVYAGNIGSAQLAGGAAAAAGTIGSGNAISGALNNAAGSYYASQYAPGSSQVPSSAIMRANMSVDPIASLNESQGWTR